MSRLLKWVFRPAVLVGVLMALIGTAALVVFQSEPAQKKPQPAVVQAGEHEVAFLYPATNNAAWERFVSAVERSRDRLQTVYPGVEVQRDLSPESAQAPPAVALTWPGEPGRVVFRWYKLTSDWSPQAWADALLARKPPPLAVVGGNNSYWGRELALALARAAARVSPADRPLMLLTTATADKVPAPAGPDADKEDNPPAPRWGEEGTVDLNKIYPGRMFRFCFTNRQMATSVTRFIWNRPELRPDSDPAFITQWLDDAYSKDLVDRYRTVLDHRAADNFLQQWGFVTGCVALGLHPATLAGWRTSAFYHPGNEPLWIDSSVGSFAAPNPYEARAVQDLLSRMKGPARTGGAAFPGPPLEGGTARGYSRLAGPRRPLLVVTGQAQPSRRFLRELARSAPKTARRFVVAMGDAVPFNTIYRDRLVTWPIQDLPFHTIFFCHRNPIDTEAGFHPLRGQDPEERSIAEETGTIRSSSGTEDLLLFSDIVEALALVFVQDGEPCTDADQLSEAMLEIHLDDGRLNREYRGVRLFREGGQRVDGTGEHVVYLRPSFQGDRVLPEAVLEVWSRETTGESDRIWHRVGSPMTLSFDEFKVHGDRSYGGD